MFRLHRKKVYDTQISTCLHSRRNLAESFGLCGTVHFPLVSSACVVECKTRVFCWDSDGTTVNSTATLIKSLQHFESFDDGHIIPTVHAMSFTFSGNLCRVGSLCGGRRQRLCAAGHRSIQISWRLHDGAICD